jgi:hypothetical protein
VLEHQVPKQHYQVSTYRAQSSIGYLIKRAHSLMLDVLETVLEKHGFTFVQYVILSWLRAGIARCLTGFVERVDLNWELIWTRC